MLSQQDYALYFFLLLNVLKNLIMIIINANNSIGFNDLIIKLSLKWNQYKMVVCRCLNIEAIVFLFSFWDKNINNNKMLIKIHFQDYHYLLLLLLFAFKSWYSKQEKKTIEWMNTLHWFIPYSVNIFIFLDKFIIHQIVKWWWKLHFFFWYENKFRTNLFII